MISKETVTFTPDNLFAATQVMAVVADTMTIAQSGELKRGTLLTAAGAVVSSSGSETVTYDDVYAVLAEDVDTTSGAKDAPVYLTGEFNENALIVSSGNTVANYKASARKVGIFIKKNV